MLLTTLVIWISAISGPIQKKPSMSEDSSSDSADTEECALVNEPILEQNLRRLQDEELKLLEQKANIEAGNVDDFTALEHQDAMRLNQLQQRELQRRQALLAQRLARYQRSLLNEPAGPLRRERDQPGPRRRTTCTVRVNNLHAAEAIETDV